MQQSRLLRSLVLTATVVAALLAVPGPARAPDPLTIGRTTASPAAVVFVRDGSTPQMAIGVPGPHQQSTSHLPPAPAAESWGIVAARPGYGASRPAPALADVELAAYHRGRAPPASAAS